MSDRPTCPECGSDLHDSEFGLSRIFECGTAESVVYGLRQSDCCLIRQLKAAGLNAINTLRNARDRTDSYEDDLEYERAIDELIKAGCGQTTEGQE